MAIISYLKIRMPIKASCLNNLNRLFKNVTYPKF